MSRENATKTGKKTGLKNKRRLQGRRGMNKTLDYDP